MFFNLVKLMAKRSVITATDADGAVVEFEKFIDSGLAENYQTDRLDTFFSTAVGASNEYTLLWCIIRKILVLSHGNATVSSSIFYFVHCYLDL
jgi:hypothetical protein